MEPQKGGMWAFIIAVIGAFLFVCPVVYGSNNTFLVNSIVNDSTSLIIDWTRTGGDPEAGGGSNFGLWIGVGNNRDLVNAVDLVDWNNRSSCGSFPFTSQFDQAGNPVVILLSSFSVPPTNASALYFKYSTGTTCSGGGGTFDAIADPAAYFSVSPLPVVNFNISFATQLKSDAATPILEGQATTEDTVVFGGTLTSSSTNQMRLEVEVATSAANFTGSATATSSPVSSGTFSTTTVTGLSDGSYYWRARAVDVATNVASEWQEFGTPGNTDFVVHTVPLFTQTDSAWGGDFYGNGGIGGYVEFPVTLSATDNFTLTINAKDTSAPNNKRAKYQVNLYSANSSVGNSLITNTISLPSGDDTYKNISLALGSVPAGSYKLRLTSERAYVDPNNPTSVKTLAYVNSVNVAGSNSGINITKLAEDSGVIVRGGFAPFTDGSSIVAKIDGYSCGRNLAQCGCFIASMAMLLRYFPNPHHNDVDPGLLNKFFQDNSSYSIAGDFLDRNAVNRYSNFQVVYDLVYSSNTTDQFGTIRNFVNVQGVPVISREASGRGGVNVEHFLVIDKALTNSYFGVKDPYWRNTTNLNIGYTDAPNFIRNYEGHSDGLRVFAVGTGATDAAYAAINIGSPAELVVTDPQGRKLGRDPVTNTTYNDIPGGSYLVENIDDPGDASATRSSDHKIAYIPGTINGQYDVKVIGTDTGPYSVTTINADAQNQTRSQVFFGDTQQNFSTDYSLNINSTSTASSTATVNLASISTAKVWIGLKNSDDVGIKFDLLGELYKNNTLVASGTLNSVVGGSSGFNNAHLFSIPMSVTTSTPFSSGDTLSLKVYARNACSGSGHNSGTARLWYGDSGANSNAEVTLESKSNYFLEGANQLLAATGTIRSSVDVSAGAKCSAYKPFGTWNIAL